MGFQDPSKPRSRTHELIVQEMQDETLVYDEHNHRAHCLNASAALIWKSCDGARTVSEIANQVSRELGAPVTDEIVLNAIDKLSRRRLMTEPSRPSVRRTALTRREVLRNLGRGAVVAIHRQALACLAGQPAPPALSAAAAYAAAPLVREMQPQRQCRR
jgi:Coenzyme PQQ synthesis protein D (PqqD)